MGQGTWHPAPGTQDHVVAGEGGSVCCPHRQFSQQHECHGWGRVTRAVLFVEHWLTWVCERAGEHAGARSPAGPSSPGRTRSRTGGRWPVRRCPTTPCVARRRRRRRRRRQQLSLPLSLPFSPPGISCLSPVSRRPPQADAALAAKTAGWCKLLQVISTC